MVSFTSSECSGPSPDSATCELDALGQIGHMVPQFFHL